MSLGYNEKNIVLAKNLRKNATPEEKHLWYDFLCHKAKLIIELDGSQHYTENGRQDDVLRTNVLEGYGLTVIRITNKQIKTNFQGVCKYIDRVVQEILQTDNSN